uniref:Uncharacterized protein n=1 Tax=Oryza rufipogon TaxID=4529 RepID=A0A0E0N4E1_ORYRU
MDQIKGTETNQLHQSEEQINQMDLKGTSEVSKEQKISKISKGSTSAPESAKRKITTVAGQDKALIESYNKEIVDKHNTSNESDLVQGQVSIITGTPKAFQGDQNGDSDDSENEQNPVDPWSLDILSMAANDKEQTTMELFCCRSKQQWRV